jgi:hypothetical protein
VLHTHRTGSAVGDIALAFTDIVASTERAALLGDHRWRGLLDNHDAIVGHKLQRFFGWEANTAEDGFVATFTSPSATIACADAIVDAVHALGIQVLAGIPRAESRCAAPTCGHDGAHRRACGGPCGTQRSAGVLDGARHRHRIAARVRRPR